MPTSPLNLIQEQQVGKSDLPWRIMVVCALLNKTHGRQVRPIVDKVFELWPTPQAMIDSGLDMMEILRPLGLYQRRMSLLKAMSEDYLQGKDPSICRGCGQYCVDSINIFVRGLTDVVTSDTWLNQYLEWKNAQTP